MEHKFKVNDFVNNGYTTKQVYSLFQVNDPTRLAVKYEDNGYDFEDSLTLVWSPKFQIGDQVIHKSITKKIQDYCNEPHIYALDDNQIVNADELTEVYSAPKFKLEDKVLHDFHIKEVIQRRTENGGKHYYYLSDTDDNSNPIAEDELKLWFPGDEKTAEPIFHVDEKVVYQGKIYKINMRMFKGDDFMGFYKLRNLDDSIEFEAAEKDLLLVAETPKKADQDKNRVDLLPVEALEEIAQVFTFGAKKYADYNYMKGEGLKYSRVYGAAIRHLFAWFRGEEKDPESGYSHLAHAGCCVLMLLSLHRYRKEGETDDRPRFNRT